MKPKAIILCGGPASTTLAFLLGMVDCAGLLRRNDATEQWPSALRARFGLEPEGYALHLVSIAEQPCHRQERRAARLVAALLDVSYEVLDPCALALLPATAAAALPTRLVALAGAVVLRESATMIAAGHHVGSHFAQEWAACAALFNQAAGTTMGMAFPRLHVIAPLAQMGLAEIIKLGAQLGVPLAATWSCIAISLAPQ